MQLSYCYPLCVEHESPWILASHGPTPFHFKGSSHPETSECSHFSALHVHRNDILVIHTELNCLFSVQIKWGLCTHSYRTPHTYLPVNFNYMFSSKSWGKAVNKCDSLPLRIAFNFDTYYDESVIDF